MIIAVTEKGRKTMTITQYEKATVLLQKINKLEDFIKLAEKHNGFFIRPYNTDISYALDEENKALIMVPLRSLLGEWKQELERL